jgi:hypothetical protein
MAAKMQSFKGGCPVVRLTVELMSRKPATRCELSVWDITPV